MDVRLGRETKFGVAAVDRRTDDEQFAVNIAPTGELGAGWYADQRGIDDDAITNREPLDLGADGLHRAREIHARNVREMKPRHREPAVALHDVEVVQRGGGDGNDHIFRRSEEHTS